MNLYHALYDISKTVQSQPDHQHLVQCLLDRVLAFTTAEKGFIVVREQGSFQEKYRVRYEGEGSHDPARQFSRSLVRRVIRSGETLTITDLSADDRFAGEESVMSMGRCAIIAAPLRFRDQVNGVIYLEKDLQQGSFSKHAVVFVNEFLTSAGTAIGQALEREELLRFKRFHQNDALPKGDFAGIVGRHPETLRMLETVAKMAPTEATVLVRGETGTGKELIAKALFLNSKRANKPFVTLHCGALPETLFEAELFGHLRGAFTGAQSHRSGRIAQAHEGTLFIDEVAEIPLPSQAKLLRFFQFGEFQRIGSDKVEKVDVRIVAATHRDLEQMVAEGNFRQDLYYRLNVMELQIPPLRKRQSDIPLLASHFLQQLNDREGKQLTLDPAALGALEAYEFPGNIRELAHLIERSFLLANGPKIQRHHLPAQVQPKDPVQLDQDTISFPEFSKENLKKARDRAVQTAAEKVERAFLEGLLRQSEGNISRAAQTSGFQRTYLHKLIAKYK